MANVLLGNVCKMFDKTMAAAKDVAFEVKDREFMVLVGAARCGKSAILRLIAGLETVSGGEIFIDNKMVNPVPLNRKPKALSLPKPKVFLFDEPLSAGDTVDLAFDTDKMHFFDPKKETRIQ